MIEQEINKASMAIKEEKERLISFLRDRMSTIVFPENQNPVEDKQGSASATNENLPKYLLGGGVAGVIVGLCVKATTLWVLGGVVGAIGAYMMLNKRNAVGGGNSMRQENQEFDFSKMANSIYKSLEGAHAHITKEWDSFLGQQNAFLSSAIRMSDYSEEKKAEMIDRVTKRSLIGFPMMDAFTELNSVSKAKDIAALKRAKDAIVDKYVREIKRACEEQLSTYASL